MDHDDIIGTIPEYNQSVPTPILPAYSTESSGIGIMTIGRYFLIFLIVAFLGSSVFGYLGEFSQWIMSIFRPIISFFGYGAAETTKQVVNTSARGTKGLVDVTAGAATSGVNLLEQGLTGKKQINSIDKSSSASGSAAAMQQKVKRGDTVPPMSDDTGSRIQANPTGKKSGYCYIGEDRGFRSCIRVDDSDMCMSGDIFPTSEICINPNLRE
jgi:hypothetical protein